MIPNYDYEIERYYCPENFYLWAEEESVEFTEEELPAEYVKGGEYEQKN